MAIVFYILSKTGIICESYHIKSRKYALSAPTNFDMGEGGQWLDQGGLRGFLMEGAGAGLHPPSYRETLTGSVSLILTIFIVL